MHHAPVCFRFGVDFGAILFAVLFSVPPAITVIATFEMAMDRINQMLNSMWRQRLVAPARRAIPMRAGIADAVMRSVALLFLTFWSHDLRGQAPATVRIDAVPIKTYLFSNPESVPILVRDSRLYPYHAYSGYSDSGDVRNWRVVTLENDYIKVFVLPDAGGKVWGAIEKSTGEEFIYRNEVMKFRNIALRGPWTSGGIEFNFGVIGHTPSTAAPVDFRTFQNDDGSVSCVVGAMDFPSRTEWRVEIRLPSDKAYFETRTTWYNPTPIEQPYYNWMTAAAFARDDLVMTIPGNEYLKHSGEALPWPVDAEGRDLSVYANNTFEGHKSYHVVGVYDDFFGGYYSDADYGFGHWSPYGDMPGQKLWLWALSRQGGIWEDLLTDTDGQYVEYQAGRLFVQYSPGDHANPITQVGFEPYRTDRWTERWFPLKEIGGLSDASGDGAMHVTLDSDLLSIRLNPFGRGSARVIARQRESVVLDSTVSFMPMDLVSLSAKVDASLPVVVEVPELDLSYATSGTTEQLKRPFAQDPEAFRSLRPAERQYFHGRELMKARRYTEARTLLDSVLVGEPWHVGALLAVAELDYRSGNYLAGLSATNRVLQLDTYHPQANYLAGILYRAAGDAVDARESLVLAARSTGFRAAALTEIAELDLQQGLFTAAMTDARRALDYDRFGVSALQSLAIASRHATDQRTWSATLDRIFSMDPINHFELAERYLAAPSGEQRARKRVDLVTGIRGELRAHSYLELGIAYASRGRVDDAIRILDVGVEETGSALIGAWLAWLTRGQPDNPRKIPSFSTGDAAKDRPYRTESVAVLEWVASNDSAWQWRYLLALDYWAVGRLREAAGVMGTLLDIPHDPSVYIARASLRRKVLGMSPEADLATARRKAPLAREPWLAQIGFYESANQWRNALDESTLMMQQYPDDDVIKVVRARALLHSDKPERAIEILDQANVLPAENAGDARTIYSLSNTMAGITSIEKGRFDEAILSLSDALSWPEHLGQGKPYSPEERLIRSALAVAYERQGKAAEAADEWKQVADGYRPTEPSSYDYLSWLALSRMNRERDGTALRDRIEAAASPSSAWILAVIDGRSTVSEVEPEAFGLDSVSRKLFMKALGVIDKQ